MIYAKLAAIQKELFVPKGQVNDYGGFNYRSCEDILQAVKPLCEANGCTLFITNEINMIGDRFYVCAAAHLIDLETGEDLVSSAQAREDATRKGMDGSQITGAASSYARKYALAGLFCIDNEIDTDETYDGETEEKPEFKKNVDACYLPTKDGVVTQAQWDKLTAEMERTGITANTLQTIYKVKDIKDMNQSQVIAALNKFLSTKDKA